MSQGRAAAGGESEDPTRPRFTDKRRIDPETGAVREPAGTAASTAGGETSHPTGDLPDAVPTDSADAADAFAAPAAPDLGEGHALAAERLGDLQRLQAEYVNYRRRVDRDRLVARDQTVVAMVESLLGALDDIELARQHGELAGGPFAAIAEKIETSLTRFGWERYGAVGETFDPNVHEALMHAHSDEVTEPTVVQVLQPGHRVGERIVRAARVAVAEPGGE